MKKSLLKSGSFILTLLMIFSLVMSLNPTAVSAEGEDVSVPLSTVTETKKGSLAEYKLSSINAGNLFSITFTNDTTEKKNVVFSSRVSGGGTSNAENLPTLEGVEWVSSSGGYNISTIVTLEPNATKTLAFTYSDAQASRIASLSPSQKVYTISFSYEYSVTKSYENISTDKKNPIAIESGKEYQGSGRVGKEVMYYQLTLADASAVRLSLNGTAVGSKTLSLGENGQTLEATPVSEIRYFAAGTYLFCIVPEDGASKEYTFKCEFEPLDYGKIKITQVTKKIIEGKPFKVNVEYTPGMNFGVANVAKLSTFELEYNSDVIESPSNKFTAEFNAGSIGRQTLKAFIEVPSDAFGTIPNKYISEVVYAYPAPPQKVFIEGGTNKSLTLYTSGIGYSDKCKIGYEFRENKAGAKWKNVLDAKIVKDIRKTVKGLKPDTKYQVRSYIYLPKTAEDPELKSDYSSVVNTKTAPNAPQLKSVKVTKSKYRKVPKRWVKGHWVGDTWYPGYWEKEHWVTDVTLQVVLKKKVTGAEYIHFDFGGKNAFFATSKVTNKTSYTVTFTGLGKIRGRQLTAKAFASVNKELTIKSPWSNKIKTKIK